MDNMAWFGQVVRNFRQCATLPWVFPPAAYVEDARVTEVVVLRTLSDMTLANAERLAFDGASLELGDEARAIIAQGRSRFEAYLDLKGGYVYGSTTAPGSRAKVLLSAEASRRQGETLRNFLRG